MPWAGVVGLLVLLQCFCFGVPCNGLLVDVAECVIHITRVDVTVNAFVGEVVAHVCKLKPAVGVCLALDWPTTTLHHCMHKCCIFVDGIGGECDECVVETHARSFD